MATRKENADLLSKRFGIEIDTEKSDPKAGTLQGWADRVENDADGVERELIELKLQQALGVEQIDQQLPLEKLRSALKRAETEPDLVRSEVQPVDTSTLEVDEGNKFGADEDTFEVRVVESVAAYGGTVTDPEQPVGHRVIGGTPVTVRTSQTVSVALKNGTLQRV